MEHESAHKDQWQIFEVVFGAPFLVSIVLHFLAPLPSPQGVLRVALLAAGIVLIVAGSAVVVAARRELGRYRQPTDPGQPTTRMVKTGVFGFSRNPLYLGGVGFLLGLALALNMLWAVVTLAVSLVLCVYVLILPEERYLAAKFGSEYMEYAATVRRWLGRK